MADEIVQKSCPHCGSPFRCGPGLGANASGCWCYDLPVVQARSGSDCLCPACLAARARAQSACDDQPDGNRPVGGIHGST